MATKRKTRDEWEIQQFIAPRYGWERVCTETMLKEAKERLKEYRENQPEYDVRMVKKRIKIKEAEE
jgi:hypothetical protein